MKTVKKKLILQKEIVTNLNVNHLSEINGGTKKGNAMGYTEFDCNKDSVDAIISNTKTVLNPATEKHCDLSQSDGKATGNSIFETAPSVGDIYDLTAGCK